MIGRLIIIAAISLFTWSTTFATPQQPNILIFEGKHYPVHFDPMEKYFEQFPERKPKVEGRRSSLWRGYIAVFEIVDNDLYLKDIVRSSRWDRYTPEPSNSFLFHVVPDGKPLKIDWYTGLILSSYGENSNMDTYDLHYDDGYESFTIFEIENGNFRRSKNFDNKAFHAFRKKQLEAFKKTLDYKEPLKKLSINGRSKEDSESIIQDFILNYTTKILVGQ